MLKGLMGIFYLLLTIVLLFVFIKFINRRLKKALKPQKLKVDFAVAVDKKTAAPQLLNQIVLMLPGENNEVLSRLTILMNDGTKARIDLLLVCPTGIYLFNSENREGYVRGSETSRFWEIQHEDGSRETFPNPIEENKRCVQALRVRYPELKEAWFHDYVVFSNRCGLIGLELPNTQSVVLNRKALFERLRIQVAEETVVMAPERVRYFYNRLKPYMDGEPEPLVPGLKAQERPAFSSEKTAGMIHEVKPPDLTCFLPEEQYLKDKLLAFTRMQSQKEGGAASDVLNKEAVENLVNMKPLSIAELETVQGITDEQSRKYGQTIIEVIQEHCREAIEKAEQQRD